MLMVTECARSAEDVGDATMEPGGLKEPQLPGRFDLVSQMLASNVTREET
jgi:hypothetical protein